MMGTATPSMIARANNRNCVVFARMVIARSVGASVGDNRSRRSYNRATPPFFEHVDGRERHEIVCEAAPESETKIGTFRCTARLVEPRRHRRDLSCLCLAVLPDKAFSLHSSKLLECLVVFNWRSLHPTLAAL